MLQELYKYSIDNGIAMPPGYKPKKIKAYVLIGKNGKFIGAESGPADSVWCLDIGSAAQGPSKCNILVEKRQIPLSDETFIKKCEAHRGKNEAEALRKKVEKKRKFFIETLELASESVPAIAILIKVLNDPQQVAHINDELDRQKIKSGDIIGFKVDGIPLEQTVKEWWPDFYQSQGNEKTAKARKRCFITGKAIVPVSTVAKISGLRSVGGHSSGDAIVCFDKDAFCSYGLKQAENACLDEEAVAGVNAALNQLIQKAPVLAGAKWIHWYKESLQECEEDPLGQLFGEASDSEDGEDETEISDAESDIQRDMADVNANALIKSHQEGKKASSLKQNIYYIMPLSGAAGRVMVRGWQQGSYEELQAAMNSWWEDLELTDLHGSGLLSYPKLSRINYRLLKPQQSSGKSLNDRMKEELAGIEPRLIFSIINNAPLPDSAASGALRYIRSKMLDGGDSEKKKEPIPDGVACQILKAWLIRKNNLQRGKIMQNKCNEDYTETAYHCGRLMAVYAAIQTCAMGNNIGAGIIQRYYTSACTTPALVFGRLSQLSQHHLAKIDDRGLVVYYEKMLSEISQKIGHSIPVILNLQQQAEFALGYYQQRASMFAKKG